MRVGYGKNLQPASAVRQAMATMGGAGEPLLLMAFVGGKHDPAAVRAAIGAEFGPVPVVGGSAAGAISRDGLGYGGFEIGLVAFDDPATVPIVINGHDLDVGEEQAGEAIGVRVRGLACAECVVMLMFDSVAGIHPPRLHHASSLVRGFQRGVGNANVNMFGGGLLTDMNMSGAWVFDGQEVRKHVVTALHFPPTVAVSTAIFHGCRPVSSFMAITRIDGATVYELDGEPALQVIERMLDLPIGGSDGQELSLLVTLGQKQGERYAPFDESSYVNRLILTADQQTGSITLFEPDFHVGSEVQIMSRDNALMLDSVRRGVAALNQATEGQENLLGVYIDCAGRASARSGAAIEEAELVVQGLNPSIPLMGFYSGVEVAPFAGLPSRPLDWTGVLSVLHKRR
jgi:hypothetical protein